MSHLSTELDRAKDILSTYQGVNDTPHTISPRGFQTKLHKKNKELENELEAMKEKYKTLQNEFSSHSEQLARLNRQLMERTHYMTRLQEDYENAIYQLERRESK